MWFNLHMVFIYGLPPLRMYVKGHRFSSHYTLYPQRMKFQFPSRTLSLLLISSILHMIEIKHNKDSHKSYDIFLLFSKTNKFEEQCLYYLLKGIYMIIP